MQDSLRDGNDSKGDNARGRSVASHRDWTLHPCHVIVLQANDFVLARDITTLNTKAISNPLASILASLTYVSLSTRPSNPNNPLPSTDQCKNRKSSLPSGLISLPQRNRD